jgi:hypothetical protein
MKTPSSNQKIALHYQGTPTAAFTPTGLDCLGFDGGHAVFAVQAVDGANADVTLLHLEESADNSAWSDVSGATLADIDADTNAAVQLCSVKLRGRKRYLRLAGTGGGSHDTVVTIVSQLVGPRESNDCSDTYVFEL